MTAKRQRKGTSQRWRAAGLALWNPRRWLAALRRNALLKVLSVVAASSLWLFVNAGARDTEIALQVPLKLMNIPSQLMLLGPRVDYIDVRVSGPRTILGSIDRDRLAIPLDLRGVRRGRAVFRIGADSLEVPRGARISLINPSRVTLELEQVGRKVVPVRVELDGEVPDGLTVHVTKVAPAAVEIEGPAPEVRGVEFVQAKPVPIAVEEAGVREFETELVSPGQYVTVKPPTIAVEVAVAEQIVTRELALAVEVRGAAHDAALAPDKIQLTLRGPKRLLDALDADAVTAYVDAAGQKPGVYLVSPQVSVPEGAEVAQQLPAELRLELTAPEKQEEGATKAEQ